MKICKYYLTGFLHSKLSQAMQNKAQDHRVTALKCNLFLQYLHEIQAVNLFSGFIWQIVVLNFFLILILPSGSLKQLLELRSQTLHLGTLAAHCESIHVFV